MSPYRGREFARLGVVPVVDSHLGAPHGASIHARPRTAFQPSRHAAAPEWLVE